MSVSENKYLLRCLDAKYSEDTQEIVLNCVFVELGIKRIVCFHKEDFHYKNLWTPVPDAEMHKTCDLWKNKLFYMVFSSDESSNLSSEQQSKYFRMFADEIGNHLQEVTEGLNDDSQKIQRKIGQLMNKNSDIDEMIKRETAIRKKLSSLSL